ncbi:MAG: AAA family ATPase [Nitrosomonas sp.]|nr:AAA family ATPase [Nitrosomonas sp.]MDP1951261.1 AAA family ATPase [Nitrosomonas sp.]
MSNEIERATSALLYLDAGCSREEWVRAGMGAKSAGVAFDEFHRWSASGGNYASESECRTVWKSFSASGPVTPATLFGLAFEQGWQDPAAKLRTKERLQPDCPIPRTKQAPQTPVKQVKNSTAAAIWGNCVPATQSHPYIDRKQGSPDGLRTYPKTAETLRIDGVDMTDALVIPCFAPDGETLLTLQFIPLVGQKKNLPGASFNDGFFTVGNVASAQKVYIVEGIGQAWAANKATGAAAVVCFGSGRMATVTKVLRDKCPAARLVIVPDKGLEAKAAKIAADVAAPWVELPADKPQNYDVSDYLLEHGAGVLTALLEHPLSPPVRYKLLSDDDLGKLPPLQWRIKGVLPTTGLAALYGPSGSGKSFLVLDALQAVAEGRDWFGCKTKPCNIVYCCLEGESGLAGRVTAYHTAARRWGVSSSNIRYLVQPFNLLDEADVNDLFKAIRVSGQDTEVVVLDTLNRAAPGTDENDSKSMGLIIAAAKQLQTLTGGLVLLVHHTGKDATKGLRGHSSLHAALDAAVEVRRDGDRREWLIAKSKDGEDGEAHPFKLDVVEIGTDTDGEPVTSCVLHPLEVIADGIKKVMPPKSGNQRVVWDVLGEIFRKAGITRPEGAPDTLPEGKPCITLEAAIDQTRTKLICDPRRQTERSQAAIRGLIDRGLLCHEDGFLWCK